MNYTVKMVKISLLQAMEAHRLRQTANRWRQGCQSYAPAALYPQVSLFLKIPGTHSYAMGTVIKRPGREDDHSSPISAEVKKMWMYTSTPPYAFMA
jgi:hypothetical protein